MKSNYALTGDPIFYITVGFFALLTTAMPAGLAQPRFLLILQTICLTIFLAMAIRAGHIRHAFNVMIIWLVIQFLAMALLAWLIPSQIERVFTDGYNHRMMLFSWLQDYNPPPMGLTSQPLSVIGELLGVVVGSVISGGLIGIYFLERAVNLAGYNMGSLLLADHSTELIAALWPWLWLRLAGYGGLVILLAEPLLTSNWSPLFYKNQRGRLLLIATGLVIIGLTLELVLPSLWQSLFGLAID